MVAEVPQDPVQPRRVQLCVVDEEQDEETGEALVVEQLATSELRVGCSRNHLVEKNMGKKNNRPFSKFLQKSGMFAGIMFAVIGSIVMPFF